MIIRDLVLYENWTNFKTELQRRSGMVILNALWHQVKPKSPLPWRETQMRESIALLSGRIMKIKKCPKCGGNLALDRDIDGPSMWCIQCGFEIVVIQPPAPKPQFAGLRRLESKTAVLHHV